MSIETTIHPEEIDDLESQEKIIDPKKVDQLIAKIKIVQNDEENIIEINEDLNELFNRLNKENENNIKTRLMHALIGSGKEKYTQPVTESLYKDINTAIEDIAKKYNIVISEE